MEALLSAVASDLVGRLVSFLISKFQEPLGSSGGVVRLQRALLRARAVVEEADARLVTNRAMLLQLNRLRREMYRGAYVLDAFTRRAVEPSRRRSRAMARRSLGLRPGSDATGRLSVVVESIEAALSDMKEFVVLLGSCPRLNRQPYSAYLFMERCMFGRQMEKEQIISFLLRPAQDFEVLPVIGPHEVGKRTLVEHVCLEERVRDHFSKIHYLNSDDLILLPSHDHHQGLTYTAERSLFVIDLAGGDKDEEHSRGFLSSVRRSVHGESKVIIISRTEAHSGLGTVPPLRLRVLRREELWYYFKTMAFGGADPEERPELVRIAMALFVAIPDLTPFAAVNKIAVSLHTDLSVRSWRRVLRVSAGVTVLRPQLGAAGGGQWIYFPHVGVAVDGAPPSAPCLFYDRRKLTGVARSELPEVAMLEVGHGVVSSGGEKRFDVLVWQSRIPPYASYVATCDMETAAQVEVDKKRLLNKRRREQLVVAPAKTR
ncbi:unnamed protein product [Urochloa decumbens]|uniref:Disease resistance N-terminal domain-containing protein n=1 Tax=Urochloa decumbens TaxID=240449 RepID=A0ABC8ZC09_9POAL